MNALRVIVLPQLLAISRLEPSMPIPDWAVGDAFLSISRTRDELSVVCEDKFVPDGSPSSRGWRALKIEGPFDLDLVGVLVSVAVPLAQSG
ncbi:MAG: ACT domain-containing protein, partial [Verrucomicrobia bacterium]|nr:ACT domain-containing protein [Verrucomicrobiota bacterium]